MGLNGGSIAVGLADGVLKGLELRRRWERDDEDRAARADDRAALQEDRAYKRKERDRADSLEIALQNAAKPATVSETGTLPAGLQYASNEDADAAGAGQPNAPMPAVPRFRLESGAGVQRFDTQQEADAAAAKANDPAAMNQRVSQAYLAAGKPSDAIKFQQEAEKFGQEHFRRKLGDAMKGGFSGLESLINESESGQFAGKRVKAIPSQDGKTITFHTVDEKGNTQPTPFTFPNDQKGVVQAGYMLDQAVTPESRYKLMVEEDRKTEEGKRKDRELEEVKIPLAEARGSALKTQADAAETRASVAELKAEIAKKGGGGGARTTADERAAREERMRYTTLHGEAGRRLSETQKTLRSLQTDMGFMVRAKKPGTPESAQLANLEQDLNDYKEQREFYANRLADAGEERRPAAPAAKAGTAAPAAAPAAPGAAGAPASTSVPPSLRPGRPGKAGKVAAPTTKAEYEALKPGEKYQHPDDPPGTLRTKK